MEHFRVEINLKPGLWQKKTRDQHVLIEPWLVSFERWMYHPRKQKNNMAPKMPLKMMGFSKQEFLQFPGVYFQVLFFWGGIYIHQENGYIL